MFGVSQHSHSLSVCSPVFLYLSLPPSAPLLLPLSPHLCLCLSLCLSHPLSPSLRLSLSLTHTHTHTHTHTLSLSLSHTHSLPSSLRVWGESHRGPSWVGSLALTYDNRQHGVADGVGADNGRQHGDRNEDGHAVQVVRAVDHAQHLRDYVVLCPVCPKLLGEALQVLGRSLPDGVDLGTTGRQGR